MPDSDGLEEIEIPNPDAHYLGASKTIKVRGRQLSEREMIEQVDMPQGGPKRYSHRYWDGKKWKPCAWCGDLIGVPSLSRGGPLPSLQHIEKSCSKYGKY